MSARPLYAAPGRVRDLVSLGLLPPWTWWSVLPVAVGFALLWAGVDAVGRSPWLLPCRLADEPAATSEPAAV